MRDQNSPVEALEGPSDGLTDESGTDTGQDTAQAAEDVFSREYVEQLREEAKATRIAAESEKAVLSEMVNEFAIRVATAGILADPSDLAWRSEFSDSDTGRPSLENITAAAEALAKAKPHLARVRGNVGQGEHSESQGAVSLSALLRA